MSAARPSIGTIGAIEDEGEPAGAVITGSVDASVVGAGVVVTGVVDADVVVTDVVVTGSVVAGVGVIAGVEVTTDSSAEPQAAKKTVALTTAAR